MAKGAEEWESEEMGKGKRTKSIWRLFTNCFGKSNKVDKKRNAPQTEESLCVTIKDVEPINERFVESVAEVPTDNFPDDLTAEEVQLKRYRAKDVQELTRIFVFIRLWKTREEDEIEFNRIKETLSVEQCEFIVSQFCSLPKEV